MASPGQLVRTIAESLGVPEPTVTQHDRNLTMAGLRTKGGRGPSAAKVTAQDAANLLIAVAAAPIAGPVIKETIATFEKYANLPAHVFPNDPDPSDSGRISKRWLGTWPPELALPSLSALPVGHCFREALASFIAAASFGEFERLFENDVKLAKRSSRRADDHWIMEVSLYGPWPRAVIRFDGRPARTEVHYHEHPSSNSDIAFVAWQRSRRKRYGDGDLYQFRTFTDRTIKSLGKLLRQGAD